MTENPGLKEVHAAKNPKETFPESYRISERLRSPLSILHYNLRFHFMDDYPAKMPEDFARDMIMLYSQEGDSVWDGCCGSGTVPRTARDLHRDGWGTDVNPKAVELCRKLDPTAPEHRYAVADARRIKCQHRYDLILSSLPFGPPGTRGKISYSDNPGDISNSPDYETFFRRSGEIIQNYHRCLKPGGVCVLDARDRIHDGQTSCLILAFLTLALDAGFELVTRYYYELIPYRQRTYKHRSTGHVMAMSASMDAIVLTKPENGRLDAGQKEGDACQS